MRSKVWTTLSLTVNSDCSTVDIVSFLPGEHTVGSLCRFRGGHGGPFLLVRSCRHCRHWVIILHICTVFKRCAYTVLDRKPRCGQAIGACAGAGVAEAHRGRGVDLLFG